MESIGFVGLGHMGGNMAARLMDAGYAVCGTARNRDAAQRLVDRGLQWLGTPREVAEMADFVLTSLPDDAVVESVSAGADGLLAGLDRGMVWMDLSTINPRVSRELADRVRREGRGAQMLDAPVSGSVPQVQAGTLTIMVGGPEDAYARVEPLLSVLGTPTRIGDNGHGLALKLAINISLAVQMLAFSEGLLLAERDGVEPHLAATVMAGSAIGSPMLKARVPLVLDKPEETWFDVGMMHKDIRLALAVGEELGAPLPSAAVADKVLDQATAAGYEHQDIASIFRLLGQVAAA
jgi:3-hydroxyisobutyrate dehydrogenase-like beta-hydroxyacid dehydrogenase